MTAAELGRAGAADVLATADWSGGGPRSLRFYRPPGLNLETTARELYALLWALVERSADGTIPLDGIVFPKVEHPEEVDLVHGMLTEAERALGLPVGRHPGRLPRGIRLGRGAAAATSRRAPRTGCARSSSASPTTPRTWACRRSPTTHPSRTGHGPDRGRGGCRGRARHRRHDPRLPGRGPGARRRGQPTPLPGPDGAASTTTPSARATSGCSASGSAIRRSCSRCSWPTRPGSSRPPSRRRRPSSRPTTSRSTSRARVRR